MTTRHFLFVALACVALAAASLLIAAEPVYDAWAWLVWGRELAGLRLDLSSGPSFKPLPAALAAPLSAAGDAAPALWLVLVRAAWLASLVLAAELAYGLTDGCRRAARLAAAAFAAVSLLLLADGVTAWGRQAAGGMSEPLLVALVLAAARAALAERVRLALVLGGLAALLRPEVWPLLGAYAVWVARAEPRARPLAAAVLVAVPLLWFGPELLDAGDALGGAGRAQRDGGGPLVALGRAAVLPLSVAWPLAVLALAGRDRRLLALAAGALAWIAIVVAMTLGGFPGLARFMAPAAAIVGVLGGAGLARLVDAPRRAAAPALGAFAVLAAVTALQVGLRTAELARAWDSAARISASHERLRALTRAVGRDALLRCGDLATSDVLVRTALAHELDVPLADVVSFGAPPRLSGAFVVGLQATARVRARLRARATPLGERGEWRVYAIGCPASASSSSSGSVRSAGVSGARR